MNIVFDLGGVLINADITSYYMNLGYSLEFGNKMEKMIFHDPDWSLYDQGIILTKEKIASLVISHNKEYERELRLFFDENWHDLLLTKLEEGCKLLYELANHNYPLYVLSNFPIDAFEWIYNKYDFFKLFKGLTVSGYVKLVKPNNDIYQKLLEMNNIKKEETIFIDDRTENIEAARKNGIKGIVYTCYEDAKKELAALGVSL